MELEGLRGLAAIAVVLDHFIFAFYPFLILGASKSHPIKHMQFEGAIAGSPLAVFFAGTFAVAIFFVLSGFVLTIGFFQTGRVETIKKLASKRYLRLMLPALASILLCFLILNFGLSNNHLAADITHSNWLNRQWNLDTSLIDAIIHGIVGIFTEGKSLYNPVLWTMTTEFLGSFIVFGFVLLFAQSRYRLVGYAVLAALTFNTWFLAFVVGMIMADAYNEGILQKLKNKYALVVCLGLGLFLGGYPVTVTHTIYDVIRPNFLIDNINFTIFYLTVGAALIVFVALISRHVSYFLRSPKISILGKYTFSLYLIHLSILFTFTTGVFLKLHLLLGYNRAVVVSMILTVPVIWVVTKLFEKYIDAPSIQFARRFATIYEGREEFDWRRRLTLLKETVHLRWVITKSRIATELRRTEDLE